MLPVQEKIKIINVDIYVNPYAELDEEEEEQEKTKEDKNAEDEENVGFPFFKNIYLIP